MKGSLTLISLMLVWMLVPACTSEEGPRRERADRPGSENRGGVTEERQGTAPGSRTTTVPSGETTRDKEESAVALGEQAGVGAVSVRVFDVRSERVPRHDARGPLRDWPKTVPVFVPRPGYGPVYPIVSGDGYVAVSVDLVLENDSSSPVAVLVLPTLKGARGGPYTESALTDAWPESEDDVVGPSEQDIELEPGEREASTAFFAVAPGAVPERLQLLFDSDYSSRGGEKEVAIDLSRDERDEIPPEDYLHVYNDYFNQRAYEEAYRMLDPSSTDGVTLGDWLEFHEPLRGERYIDLEGLQPVPSTSGDAAFFMERTFYGADGNRIPDAEVNADVAQEMVRTAEGWRLVMRGDLREDILGSRDPASTTSPASATASPEASPPSEPTVLGG